MRFPQLIVYEPESHIASELRDLAKERKWALREPRRPEECYQLLAAGGPAVVVLMPSADRRGEFTMLERIAWLYPSAAVVVVCDEEGLVDPAWDLGAASVMTAARRREELPELLDRYLGGVDAGTARP